eukprot:CAMPEP_0179428916 /NCGR_PEP_ID=MMETSP0799-20121207/14451_1 /TAXON_ID=46947 /ORGANISM="Geminigera cryophila, Strain CCMP2564" /LENGTH=57 /DNA_ID=CAMNT_0021204615 /DNA_START=560 /DNA_END=733 /DNA_ORIENTATION=+
MNGKGEESVRAKEGVREGGDRMYSLVMVNDHGAGNQETSRIKVPQVMAIRWVSQWRQ